MNATLRLLLALIALSMTTGCYLAADGRVLEQQVDVVEARQNEFMATFEEDRSELRILVTSAETSVHELESALEEARDFLNRNNANLGAELDALTQQIGELRGRIEGIEHQQSVIREEIELLREEMNLRFEALD